MSQTPKERLLQAKDIHEMWSLSDDDFAQIKSDCVVQMRGIITA